MILYCFLIAFTYIGEKSLGFSIVSSGIRSNQGCTSIVSSRRSYSISLSDSSSYRLFLPARGKSFFGKSPRSSRGTKSAPASKHSSSRSKPISSSSATYLRSLPPTHPCRFHLLLLTAAACGSSHFADSDAPPCAVLRYVSFPLPCFSGAHTQKRSEQFFDQFPHMDLLAAAAVALGRTC